MAEVFWWALTLATFVLAVVCYVALWRLWRQPERVGGVPQEAPTDWCETCSIALTPETTHRLTAERKPTVDPDTHLLAGGGISAEYCAAHCPGGCQLEGTLHAPSP